MKRTALVTILAGTMLAAFLAGCSHKTKLNPAGPQPAPATSTPTPTATQSVPPSTSTPTPTPTATQSVTPSTSATVAGGTPSTTLTATYTRTPTLAATLSPTNTFSPIPTATGTLPTGTFTPTWTNTWTATTVPTLITCSNTTTLGDETGNAGDGFTQGDIFVSRSNLYWESNVTAIKGWFENLGSAAQVEFVVYDETGGVPNRLVYASSPINFPPGAPYSGVTLTCAPNISLPAGNYWVGFWDGSGGDGMGIQHQGTGLGTVAYFLNQAVLPAVMPPLAGNGIEYDGNLTLTWDVCHLPVITPTPTPTST